MHYHFTYQDSIIIERSVTTLPKEINIHQIYMPLVKVYSDVLVNDSENQQILIWKVRRMARLLYGHVMARGVRINYYRTGGEKPPVILIHGLAEYGLGLEPFSIVY